MFISYNNRTIQTDHLLQVGVKCDDPEGINCHKVVFVFKGDLTIEWDFGTCENEANHVYDYIAKVIKSVQIPEIFQKSEPL